MRLIDIISSKAAISPIKGKIAYDYVSNEIKNSRKVVISFEGVTDLTSAFCNSFIGKLYMNVDAKTIERFLVLENVNNQIWLSKINSAQQLGSDVSIRERRVASISNLACI